MIFKQLFLFLTLLTQNTTEIFLADNGVTIKCAPTVEVGKTYSFKNKNYLIVDNELLKKLAKNKQPLENVITTLVTDMSYLFYKDDYFKGDISHWDTSNVTNMTWMFGFCKEFNGDISNWNTENVEFFNDMFHGTRNFNSDLSEWNVSKGVLFNGMFFDSVFNRDINDWNVSNALNMSGMFDNNFYFNKPLCNWDVSNVKLMGGMFAEAIQFNQDISMWDVSNVTDMTNMFRNAVKFEQDLSSWSPKIYSFPKNFNFNTAAIGPDFKKSNTTIFYWMIPLLVFFIIYLYKKNQSKKTENFKAYKDIIKKLINKEKDTGYFLTKNELDRILNIDYLNYEKQKAKRSSMIRDINNYKPTLINRVKDPNDKRSYLYEIKY